MVIVFVHFSFIGFSSACFFSSFFSFSRRLSSFSAAFAALFPARAIASLRPLSTVDMAEPRPKAKLLLNPVQLVGALYPLRTTERQTRSRASIDR